MTMSPVRVETVILLGGLKEGEFVWTSRDLEIPEPGYVPERDLSALLNLLGEQAYRIMAVAGSFQINDIAAIPTQIYLQRITEVTAAKAPEPEPEKEEIRSPFLGLGDDE